MTMTTTRRRAKTWHEYDDGDIAFPISVFRGLVYEYIGCFSFLTNDLNIILVNTHKDIGGAVKSSFFGAHKRDKVLKVAS